jgi:thioredoxin reductase
MAGQPGLTSGDIHKVWINDTIELHCETVIISTGASAKYLGLPSEQHYLKWEVEFQLSGL